MVKPEYSLNEEAFSIYKNNNRNLEAIWVLIDSL